MTQMALDLDDRPVWRELRARALAVSWSLRPWRLRYRPGTPRPGWQARRACAGLPLDMFFDQPNQTAAVAVCETCPVRQDCLHDGWAVESAVANVLDICGVRGGLLECERRRIVSAHRRTVA